VIQSLRRGRLDDLTSGTLMEENADWEVLNVLSVLLSVLKSTSAGFL
jgi:hypothetical protein